MRMGALIAVSVALILVSAQVGAQESITILTSDNPADHSVARVWADKIGAKLVVTPWGTLSQSAVMNVTSLGSTVLYVVGGKVAVPGAETEFSGLDITVIRAGGNTRFETSGEVAKRFSAKRAVVVGGFDIPSMSLSSALGMTEGIPVILLHRSDYSAGSSLKNLGITDITLISNPTLKKELKDSIRSAGVNIDETERSELISVQDMIISAQNRINSSKPHVKRITDGLTLSAATLLVESQIKLSQSREALNSGEHDKSFALASESEEMARHATYLYNGRSQGSLSSLVSQSAADLASRGIETVKKELSDRGAPYGVSLPVPPALDLTTLMVDIPNYKKSDVAVSSVGFNPDVRAKYTKGTGPTAKSVIVEVYVQSSPEEAIKWANKSQFATGTDSKNWESYVFMGYPASIKRITYDASDNTNQEVFLRVAVREFGVFSKFTESVRKADAYLMLTNQEQAQLMVKEVTAAVIKAIDENA